MDLIKFTSQLGGQDPTASPFRIPAKDLDSNFAKLRPLPTDGNARQYSIEETPEGWRLRLFPDNASAAIGEFGIGEAPEDGKTYGRKDGAWAQISPFPTPPTTGIYALGVVNGTLTWIATENCT
jgi:hypothetical protein